MEKTAVDSLKNDAIEKYGKYLQQCLNNAENGHPKGYVSFEQIQSNNGYYLEWKNAEKKWHEALMNYGYVQDQILNK